MQVRILLVLFAILLLCGLMTACGSDDDDNTDGDSPDGDVTDGDNTDGDGTIYGDDDVTIDGDEAEQDDPYAGMTTQRGDAQMAKLTVVSLTPSSVKEDSEPGDGNWAVQSVTDFSDQSPASNFGYSAAGYELGYNELSKQVEIAPNITTQMYASNQSIPWQGPFTEREQIAIEEESYTYFRLHDGDTVYYLRLWCDTTGGAGLDGSYELSESPKFPE